jgi:hypothetical protein
MQSSGTRQNAQPFGKKSLRKPLLKSLLLMASISAPVVPASGNSLHPQGENWLLWNMYCMIGTDFGDVCKDYNTNSSAYVYAGGDCFSNVTWGMKTVQLDSFAYGACTGWTVWNETNVSGGMETTG